METGSEMFARCRAELFGGTISRRLCRSYFTRMEKTDDFVEREAQWAREREFKALAASDPRVRSVVVRMYGEETCGKTQCVVFSEWLYLTKLRNS